MLQRKQLVGRTLETEDQDAFRFLTKVKERLERWAPLACIELVGIHFQGSQSVFQRLVQCRVGIKEPTVEVRFQNLTIEADVYVGERGLPSVINAYRNFVEVR